MNSNTKDWKIEYNIPAIPKGLVDAGYSPLLSLILATRGINTPEKAKSEFFGNEANLHDPFLMKDMDKAVERIKKAIDRKDSVAVYGDYDVDGITSTCLLTEYLRSKGLSVTPYIPDRNEDGYGLNSRALDDFKKQGINLVITVDCGITAVEEAAYARELGIDMIITDHHECRPDMIPDALAVIDCKQPGNKYPNPNLAGVGVSFKLACACEGNTNRILDEFVDLAAIGTIADVMLLTGENRYITIRGLEKIRSNPRCGLKAMMDKSGVDYKTVSAGSIGFSIAPRLNAAGRIDRAIKAGDLIFCNDEKKATELAVELCELNRRRQDLELNIWTEAEKLVRDKYDLDAPIVLASDKWNQGVIGIAASRLAEEFGLPTVMIYMNGDVGKGSCRSFAGFNLYEALNACSEHLISFGGHALAAGLNIHRDKIDSLRNALAKYYDEHRPDPKPEVSCDLLILDKSLLSVENVKSLASLEPFGNGNPKPVLCISGVELVKFSEVGREKHHIKLTVKKDGENYDCIFFGHELNDFRFKEGDVLDVAFTPQINEFRGDVSVQLQIQALRLHDPRQLCENIIDNGCSYIEAARKFVPSRSDFVKAWKSFGENIKISGTLDEIIDSCPEGMLPEMFCICLEAFLEAGLLTGKSVYGATERKLNGKADLDSTPLMKSLLGVSLEK